MSNLVPKEEFTKNIAIDISGKTAKFKGFNVLPWYTAQLWLRDNYPNVHIIQSVNRETGLIETTFNDVEAHVASQVEYYPICTAQYKSIRAASGCELMDAMNRAKSRAISMVFGYGLSLWQQVDEVTFKEDHKGKGRTNGDDDEDDDDDDEEDETPPRRSRPSRRRKDEEEEEDDDDDDDDDDDEDDDDEEETSRRQRPVRGRKPSNRSSSSRSRTTFRTRRQ